LWRHTHKLSHWKQPGERGEKRKEKKKLASLLTTYNPLHTGNFATRIQYNSNTAMDNIFVDNSRINLSYISRIINCLSDHDAQILTIKKKKYIYIYIYTHTHTHTYTYATISTFPLKGRTRLIDNVTIMNFQTTKKRNLGICSYRYRSPPYV
jgi:hypothetical protein